MNTIAMELINIIAEDSLEVFSGLFLAYRDFAFSLSAETIMWFLRKFHVTVRTYTCAIEGAFTIVEQFGLPHKRFGPAIIGANGMRAWCIDGVIERANGPAITYASGHSIYIRGGVVSYVTGPNGVVNSATFERLEMGSCRKNYIQDGRCFCDTGRHVHVCNVAHISPIIPCDTIIVPICGATGLKSMVAGVFTACPCLDEFPGSPRTISNRLVSAAVNSSNYSRDNDTDTDTVDNYDDYNSDYSRDNDTDTDNDIY